MMDRKAHWEHVYAATQPDEVSWYQPEPTRSLELLAEAGVGPATAIIDVGGGDATLVDALLARGLGRVTVLDLSGAALARARARLGLLASEVEWREADVTRADLPAASYDVWHDRAVFHFLTDARDRRRYVDAAAEALRPGGTLVVATFAADGPTRCSGLEVARYTPEALAAEFGDRFTLVRGFGDVHRTPTGAEQRFTFVVLRRA
jgi:SAM-dependent methyltransferase